MLSPEGAGSLDHPDNAQAVTPVVSTLAATPAAVERHHATPTLSMTGRNFRLLICNLKPHIQLGPAISAWASHWGPFNRPTTGPPVCRPRCEVGSNLMIGHL